MLIVHETSHWKSDMKIALSLIFCHAVYTLIHIGIHGSVFMRISRAWADIYGTLTSASVGQKNA